MMNSEFKSKYQPIRGMTRLCLIKDPLTLRFTNISKTEVNLIDDGSIMVRDQIKTVWNLLTHDMPRSGMPIVVFHAGETYDIFHGSGGYLMRNLNYKSTFSMQMGRPITPHHIFYIIENSCSWEVAMNELKMTEATFQSWARRKSWLH